MCIWWVFCGFKNGADFSDSALERNSDGNHGFEGWTVQILDGILALEDRWAVEAVERFFGGFARAFFGDRRILVIFRHLHRVFRFHFVTLTIHHWYQSKWPKESRIFLWFLQFWWLFSVSQQFWSNYAFLGLKKMTKRATGFAGIEFLQFPVVLIGCGRGEGWEGWVEAVDKSWKWTGKNSWVRKKWHRQLTRWG